MDVKAKLRGRHPRRRLVLMCATVLVGAMLTAGVAASGAAPSFDGSGIVPLGQVVPAPVSVQPSNAVFQLNPQTVIYRSATSTDAADAANYLAGLLRVSTGYALPVRPLTGGVSGIKFVFGGADPSTNPEGYQLQVTGTSITITANQRAGLFDGVATLRQLFPPKVDSQTAVPGPWPVAGGSILDHARYSYRGAMLDVARHFFPVSVVERYIDQISRYKINYLHLHLTDDQGWRIAINGWDDLTTIGGATGVNDMMGGYYTQADYSAIVAYAAARGITVVPEIDGPMHANAALTSYAKLNCSGVATDPYTGFTVDPDGELCIHKTVTYKFLDDVIGQIAALTPGPYIAVGSDETTGTVSPDDMAYYEQKVAGIVTKYGKKVFGWEELMATPGASSDVGQVWLPGIDDAQVVSAAQAGAQIIMSPADHAYLDMKYNPDEPAFPVGNSWIGYTDLATAYGWDPTTEIDGLPNSAIVGVEAPLFTETVFAVEHMDELAFPRLLAIAEIGWSPQSSHDYNSFVTRLAAQGPRLRAARVGYYLDPSVTWPWGS